MQLSFNLSNIDHITNTKSTQPKESKAYITLSGCVLEYIVVTKHLSNIEKLFYILANSLSIINSHSKKQRSIALSAESWAKRLNCSKSQVFLSQKSLESKGYFIISKDKNREGQDKRNLICPTLPDSVFGELCKSANRIGKQHLSFSPLTESKLQYLDRTKLFIILGYQVLKDISACEYLTPFHRLAWLDFYSRCYKTHIANCNSRSIATIRLTDLGFSFITSYQQLQDRYSCDKRFLSTALIELEEIGLIKREHFYVKKEFGDQDRQDKSLWKISLLSPQQLNNDPKTQAKPSYTISSDLRSASLACSHSAGSNKMPINTKAKIFNSTNILPNVVPTLTTEQREEYYINNILHELEDEGGDKNENHVDYDSSSLESLKKNSESDIITTAIPLDIENADGDPDKESRVILPVDPEFPSFNIYNNINTISKIYISNLGVVDKSSDSFPCSNHPYHFSNDKIEYDDRFKNCNNIDVLGEVTPKIDHRSVSRGINKQNDKLPGVSGFNVCTLLVKEKLKILPKDKADKARKFAYSLFSKKLTKGYAASITKHELAKQFIYHAATWKPTKITRYKQRTGGYEDANYNKITSGLTEDQQIDIALSVAWNSVVKGKWQEPLEWKKAKALQYEYLAYKKKYQESGIMSKEIHSLEIVVNTLLSAAGDKKPAGGVAGGKNNKGKEKTLGDKVYRANLIWNIKQEVDQELERLVGLQLQDNRAGSTSYSSQITHKVQPQISLNEISTNMKERYKVNASEKSEVYAYSHSQNVKYEQLLSNEELPAKAIQIQNNPSIEDVYEEKFIIAERVFSNQVYDEAIDVELSDYSLNYDENLTLRQPEEDIMEELPFLQPYCSSAKNTNSNYNTLQKDFINTNKPNTELKNSWGNSFQQHIGQNVEGKSSYGCGLEKSESLMFETSILQNLKELTTKNGDNGQQDDHLSSSSSNYSNEPINHNNNKLLKDFIKIDNALANILNNLKKAN